MPNSNATEKEIIAHFRNAGKVNYKENDYEIKGLGKPRSASNGEPKTDIYILLSNGHETHELKISHKKSNADFLENKISRERAQQIFGEHWEEEIINLTSTLKETFNKRPVIYKDKFRKTEKGSITLGWKFEIVNKPSGHLTGPLNLSPDQIYNVYSGANLSDDKRNAYLDHPSNPIIPNSGVANYILIADKVNSAQEIIDSLIPIREYVNQNPDLYFTCKALNYRTFKMKYDGNRPLSVQVDWKIESNKLTHKIIFDKPLTFNGAESADRLVNCLEILSIKTTDDINAENSDLKAVYQQEK
ncbi:hypothetical protein [uncultured Rothia sp.]|uniref:hypothetical protein n=1 Tax=uncultured Rothia sp. TaxID=316088 RepID=UPI0025EF4B1F|nr:hypothetical protein [uncultured Rothia sp.]